MKCFFDQGQHRETRPSTSSCLGGLVVLSSGFKPAKRGVALNDYRFGVMAWALFPVQAQARQVRLQPDKLHPIWGHYMGKNPVSPASHRLKAVPLINFCGNLFGATVTFVWFAVLEPGITDGVPFGAFWDRLTFAIAAIFAIVIVVVPIGVGRVFYPILRESRDVWPDNRGRELEPQEMRYLQTLAGRIIDLPIRASVTSFVIWILLATVFGLAPHVIPAWFPWPFEKSHKMVAWMVFIGAPTTVVFIYFVLEWWLRATVQKTFPPEVLRSIPPSYSINVLPKMLLATFMIGTLPVALISHVTLRRITEIQAGRQSLESFVAEAPLAIWFLLGWALIVAAGVAFFMSKSISEPMRYARNAMQRIGGGDLDTVVPVVSNDDVGLMGEQFNRMLGEIKELESVKDTFGRYLSQEVVTEILKSPGGVDLRGELRDITILVSDLRGFTNIAEAQAPQAVLEIMNRYFERMTDTIIRNEGTIDEFTGDGILVFFGAPRKLPDHARRAVVCGLEMQEALTELNQEFDEIGLPRLHMGIGINTGELIVGNIGSEKRKKYGAVGSPINVAFRVESHTQGGEILLTSSVYRYIDGEFAIHSTRQVQLKGIDKPVTLYRVSGRPTARS